MVVVLRLIATKKTAQANREGPEIAVPEEITKSI